MIIKGARGNIGFLLTLQQELLPLLDEREKNRNSSFCDAEKTEALEQKKQEAAEILFNIIRNATFQVDESFVDIVGNKRMWAVDFIKFASENFSKRPCAELEPCRDSMRSNKLSLLYP